MFVCHSIRACRFACFLLAVTSGRFALAQVTPLRLLVDKQYRAVRSYKLAHSTTDSFIFSLDTKADFHDLNRWITQPERRLSTSLGTRLGMFGFLTDARTVGEMARRIADRFRASETLMKDVEDPQILDAACQDFVIALLAKNAEETATFLSQSLDAGSPTQGTIPAVRRTANQVLSEFKADGKCREVKFLRDVIVHIISPYPSFDEKLGRPEKIRKKVTAYVESLQRYKELWKGSGSRFGGPPQEIDQFANQRAFRHMLIKAAVIEFPLATLGKLPVADLDRIANTISNQIERGANLWPDPKWQNTLSVPVESFAGVRDEQNRDLANWLGNVLGFLYIDERSVSSSDS